MLFKVKNWIMFIFLVTLLSACDKQTETNKVATSTDRKSEVKRSFNFAQITRGGKLFQQNCAECHGKQAEGAPNWQQMDANGKFPPPPLNGSAHAWHHPRTVLVDTIKNGTAKLGGSMPAWKDKLSDEQINDIIAWFQSKWSDEIYSAWHEMDQGRR
ncbi:MAG: cytochrome c [Gammaproteobacteria bacterium]